MSDRQFDRVEILARLKVVERGETTRLERELEAQVKELTEALEFALAGDIPGAKAKLAGAITSD